LRILPSLCLAYTVGFQTLRGWSLVSLIAKSADDLRQEVFALQLISRFQAIFSRAKLPLWLRTYRIVSTGVSTGLIEVITDAQSLDGLKKTDGFISLRKHFENTYGLPLSRLFHNAQRNFIQSMAAYSIVSYLLAIKDRHNGNILLDAAGRVVHIDFGFLLGIAPGGKFRCGECCQFVSIQKFLYSWFSITTCEQF
jgi:phosphatidylinositol 4-kinase B